MMNALTQDLDLWEVWVEYDQFHPDYFGTLYVHGEIFTDRKANSTLTKIEKGGYQLSLQLPARSARSNYTKEVLYSEPIRNLNQYTSVCIYSGDKMVAYFNNIEIMI